MPRSGRKHKAKFVTKCAAIRKVLLEQTSAILAEWETAKRAKEINPANLEPYEKLKPTIRFTTLGYFVKRTSHTTWKVYEQSPKIIIKETHTIDLQSFNDIDEYIDPHSVETILLDSDSESSQTKDNYNNPPSIEILDQIINLEDSPPIKEFTSYLSKQLETDSYKEHLNSILEDTCKNLFADKK